MLDAGQRPYPRTVSELADRIRDLADAVTDGAQACPFPETWMSLQASYATELHELAEEAERLVEPPQPSDPALCGKRAASNRYAPCDRPQRHQGDCSWETDRIRRLASDFEGQARLVPGLDREVRRLQAEAAAREGELATLREWKATLDRRGLARFWRRARQEAERG